MMISYATYHNLTLEFLSSLTYLPNHGLGNGHGLILFRIFGINYKFTHLEFADLLSFPSGVGIYQSTQEEHLAYRELDHFWGCVFGNLNPEPADFLSENIHNSA